MIGVFSYLGDFTPVYACPQCKGVFVLTMEQQNVYNNWINEGKSTFKLEFKCLRCQSGI